MTSVVQEFMKENETLLWNVSQEIWKNPELCFQEKFAHDLLTSVLESFGFVVERGYFLPTAFRAEFDSEKEGPTVAVICEYDALPGIGHACGHNLIAEVSLAAGLAVQEAMKKDPSISGKIVVLGTPAEERGGGKIILIEKGVFKDIDAAMMAHPQCVNRLYPLIVECNRMVVKFSANSENDPWEGSSAVDAAVACYNNVALIRRRIKDKWRISRKMTIPKSSPEASEVHFIYRAPSHPELIILKEEIQTCVQAASQVASCTYMLDFQDDDRRTYRGMLYNKNMVELFGKHAKAMGLEFHDNNPKFPESAVSTDMGNVTHVVPGMQPEFYIGAKAPHVNHTPGFADVAGSREAQEYTLIIAEALAKTVVDLMSNPKLMAKVKDEFNENIQKDLKSDK